MKNKFCVKRLFVVCLSITFVTSSPILAKEWYEYYFEAQQAVKQKDWETTITLLQQAIKTDPNPGKRKRTTGTRTVRYFPYLGLGKAYFVIGDHQAAQKACEESKRRGVAPKLLVNKCLRDVSQALQAKALPETPPPSQTDASAPSPELPQSPQLEPGTKIAVLNFQGLMVPDELGIAVAEILRTEIVGLGQYTVIERGMVEQVLQEQELQLTGAVDSETAVELGKLMGAQSVIIGSIVKTGTVYTINSRLIDVETGVVKIGENVQGQGEDDIPEMIHRLTLKVIHSPAK
jgi:hypothetical protein